MSQKEKKLKAEGQGANTPDLGGAWTGALSHLTKGFVHDVNNCLASILSLSENCQVLLERKEPIEKELKIIKASAQKASELLVKVNEWHTEEAAVLDYHDLNAVVEGCVESLRHVLPRRIELQFLPAPGYLPVHLNAAALRKAIVGLTLDVEDAIPGKGKISFTTSKEVATSPGQKHVGTWPAGAAVCLRIAIPRPCMESKPTPSEADASVSQLHKMAQKLAASLPGALWQDFQGPSETVHNILLAEADM